MNPEAMPSYTDLSNVTALVVEDDTSGVVMMTMMMRRLGINAYVETSGERAVALAHVLRPVPDLILVDLNLPQMSGFDVLRALRGMSHLQRVPIIAISAAESSLVLPRCQDAGFDGYIAKPIRIKQFNQQLARLLQGEHLWDIAY